MGYYENACAEIQTDYRFIAEAHMSVKVKNGYDVDVQTGKIVLSHPLQNIDIFYSKKRIICWQPLRLFWVQKL